MKKILGKTFWFICIMLSLGFPNEDSILINLSKPELMVTIARFNEFIKNEIEGWYNLSNIFISDAFNTDLLGFYNNEEFKYCTDFGEESTDKLNRFYQYVYNRCGEREDYLKIFSEKMVTLHKNKDEYYIKLLNTKNIGQQKYAIYCLKIIYPELNKLPINKNKLIEKEILDKIEDVIQKSSKITSKK